MISSLHALSYPVLFCVSTLAGFVGAMSGMGGGVVLVPALTFLGLDIKKAIALSIISVIATSSGSASSYVRDHLTNLKVGMFLEMFTILGALLGAALTLSSSGRFLFIAFGIVLFISWGALFAHRHDAWRQVEPVDGFSRWLELGGKYYDRATGETVRYHAVRAWLGGPLMFVAGVVSGSLGIGAGALKVLVHDLVMGLPLKVSTTTSNLIIGVTALAGTTVYLAHGLIDTDLAAPILVGIVAGAFVGTKLLVRLRSQSIRHWFLIVLAVLGAEMILRGVRGQ